MNDINELREHLFATLRGLRDKENPMEIDRARAVSQVAATLVDSARVEVEMLRVTGEQVGTGFIPLPDSPSKPEAASTLPPGIMSVRQHRIKG